MFFLSITLAAHFYLPRTCFCSGSGEVGQLAGKQWDGHPPAPCHCCQTSRMSPADQSQRQVPTGEAPDAPGRGSSTGPMHTRGGRRPRWVPRVGEWIWGVVTATASLTVMLGTAWKGMPGHGGGCSHSAFARSSAGCGQASAQGSGEAKAGKGGVTPLCGPTAPQGT